MTGLDVHAINAELRFMRLPTFVHSLNARAFAGTRHWARDLGYDVDYHLFVKLTNPEVNLYKPREQWTPKVNCPFPTPATIDEMKLQAMTACLMAVNHEIMETLSDGGMDALDVHRHTEVGPMAAADVHQWMALQAELYETVRATALRCPPRRTDDRR